MGKRFRYLTHTATDSDFVGGNYFGVDTPSITKKVPANRIAKQSSVVELHTIASKISNSIALRFDPNRTQSNPYLAGDGVMYNDKLYKFRFNHYGPWSESDVEETTAIDFLTAVNVEEAVNNWLDEHPEATTTVENHSLTKDKLVIGTLDFVTPAMFGAVGDGVTDDSVAINACVNSGFPVDLGGKSYKISRQIHITKFIVRNGTFIFPESESRFEPFVSLTGDTDTPTVDIENVRFVTGRTQGYSWTLDTDRPLSDDGSYNNIVLFHVSSGSGNKVLYFKALNCEFVNVDYVLKHDSRVLGQHVEFDACNFDNVVEGMITFVDTLYVRNCQFKQYGYANRWYHFTYFKGTDNTNCHLYIDNCVIDAVNYPISPGHGGDTIDSNTYDVHVSNCRVVCNAFASISDNSKHYYRNCDITARFGFFASGNINNSLYCCGCTFRWNPNTSLIPDDVTTEGFSSPIDAVIENCDISLPLYFMASASRSFDFINCTIRQVNSSLRAIRCVGVQTSIRFFNCRLLGNWDWQFGNMNCAQQLLFYQCYIYAGSFFNHDSSLAYSITLAGCYYRVRNTNIVLNLNVAHDYKEFGYENVSDTGIYVPKMVNGTLKWVAET